MPIAAGTRLGVYEFLAPIGAGGMGEVYRARDTRLGRDVALKILLPAVAQDPDRLARFRREARILASLNDPHIAQIFGFEEHDGVVALAMELIEGPTLADRIGNGPVPVDEALRIASQIADALETAHEHGVVHRDLKPANVKVRPDGTVKVLDFGLAKAIEPIEATLASDPTMTSASPMTELGVIVGTPAYMSPEQVRGQPADKRADIWAFGCILYELLTAKSVFHDKTTSDALANVLQREPDWSALPPSVPAHVRQLLRRCLEKDPKRRRRDMGDVRADLDEPPPVPASTAVRTRSASRFLWGLLAGAAVVALVWVVARPAARVAPAEDLRLEAVTTDAGYTGDPALSADGRLLAYSSDRAGAGNFDIWVQQFDGGGQLRLTDDPEEDSEPDFSPDGSQIAFHSNRNGGGIYLVPTLGGPARLLAPGGRGPRFSPDGTHLAYWAGQFRGGLAQNASETYVIALSGGPPIRVMADFAVVHSPVWAPDSRSLLVLGLRRPQNDPTDLDWWRVDADGGRPQRTNIMSWRTLRDEARNGWGSPQGAGQWTADGFVIGMHGTLWSIPLNASGLSAGEPRALVRSPASLVRSPSGRNGQIVFASVSLIRRSERLPLGSGVSVPAVLYADSNPYTWRTSTSRDGETIVFERMNGSRHEIWAKNTITGEQHVVLPVPEHGNTQINPTVSADGAHVSYVLHEAGDRSDQGTAFVADVAGGVPRQICTHCTAWGFVGDSQQAIITAEGRAIRFQGAAGSKDVVAAPAGARIDRPSVPYDARAIAFRIARGAASKVYVAPLSAGRAVRESEWVQIDEPTTTGRPCGWSPDSSLLYLLLDADGFRDLWGQKIQAGHPVGKPFVVRHLHQVIGVSTSFGNAVSTQGFLYEAGSLAGNIWRLVQRPR